MQHIQPYTHEIQPNIWCYAFAKPDGGLVAVSPLTYSTKSDAERAMNVAMALLASSKH